MARPKNPDTKTKEQEIKDKISAQDAMRNELRRKREARQAKAAGGDQAQQAQNKVRNRESFRVFWAQAKKEYGRPKELEDTLWVHLCSAGFSSPENFSRGLAHFGLTKKV